MNATGPHVGVQRGDGLVARFGASVVVMATNEAQESPFVPALLAALDAWPDEPDAAPANLAWEIAGLVRDHRGAALAFGRRYSSTTVTSSSSTVWSAPWSGPGTMSSS